MREFADATLRSLVFLTRFPARFASFPADSSLGADAHAFPLAGLLAAIPAALVLITADAAGLSPLVAATLSIGTLVLTTGALHEDGLGDVADGLFGHHGRERAIAIMKDSRIGTYGALALLLSVALRIGLLAQLLEHDPGAAALALFAAAAVSRGAMAWLWSVLPSADRGGLADRMGRPTEATGLRTLLVGDGIFLVLGALAFGILPAFAGLVLGGLVLLWFRGVIRRRLGGQSGDCLGAAQQLTEIAALVGLCLG
ncbi:adenosylcobinamide-GDP ribazoletransferase [Aurantimonas aggregata]|uniref:Adenosylcobinamide-GDP ribazoletransferase n=1 Tax=Aurantimonas aggregata TaxID=2047720 RepID=A0A6L9MKW5_9HYPH|nr:adenosylcobinamide-GDP ribazoletransferase [Aurantimonas aggregata]NDV88282.1 adenosylcobinamide-GDP ribazoletransferase [Aurantimonas aggregata]